MSAMTRLREVARSEGITPLQYLLMLHIKGFSVVSGRRSESYQKSSDPTSTAPTFISRCVRLELVKRKPSHEDRRGVQMHLKRKGGRCIRKLERIAPSCRRKVLLVPAGACVQCVVVQSHPRPLGHICSSELRTSQWRETYAPRLKSGGQALLGAVVAGSLAFS
jgi:hypothetical protein